MPQELDQSIEAIYLAVGRALSEWEEMEFQCLQLYCALLGDKNQGAMRGYGMVAGFNARIELLKAAAEHFPFLKDDRTDFTGLVKLVEEIGHLYARRNEIAHGVAGPGPVWIGPLGLSGYVLVHAGYAARKESTDNFAFGKYVYGSKEILTYAERFKERGIRASELTMAAREAWRLPEIP